MLSDVFKGMGAGLTATGKIASGSVQLYDRVAVMPANEYAAVKGKCTGIPIFKKKTIRENCMK